MIILVVLTLIIYWRIQVNRNSGLKVEVTQVTNGELVESVSASGDVSATEAANLSFQTVGEVQKVNVQAGDEVKKGDILAQLDTTNLYASLQAADATLRAAQASLNDVYDQLQGHANDESYAQIDTRTTAEATKDRAYWAYVIAKRNYEGAIIQTPYNGVVTITPANILPGSFVATTTLSTFQVVNPSTIYFSADIDELDIPKVKLGQKVTIQLDAYPSEEFDGEVTNIEYGSVITSTGGTAYRIKVSMPENDGLKFRLGMNGNAQIVQNTLSDVLTIPQTAVVETGGKSYVYTVSQDNTAKMQEVQTGVSSVNDIQITSGISEGEKIITQPPANIKDGEKLKITYTNE